MTKPHGQVFPLRAEALGTEGAALAALVRSWADREVVSRRADYRRGSEAELAAKRRQVSVDLGLGLLLAPESLGGGGLSSSTHAPAIAASLVELGRADCTLAYLTALEVAALSPFEGPSGLAEELCRRLLGPGLEDRPWSAAIALPGAGHAGRPGALFRGMTLHARLSRRGKALTVSGEGLRPLGSREASLLAVAAADERGKPALVLLPLPRDGVSFGQRLRATGLDGCPHADLSLRRAPVDADLVLEGEAALRTLSRRLDLLLGAASLGAAASFLEILGAWAEDRTIKGGERLRDNALCAALLGLVAEEVVLSGLLLAELAAMTAREKVDEARLDAMASLVGPRVQRGCLAAIDRGLELMGSAGYAREWHAEKHWRDVKTVGSFLCGVGGEVPARLEAARYFFDSEAR